MLDESLRLLDRLWSGDKVTHHGSHYVVEGVALAPLPLQKPRIPVWIGGDGPAPLRRAARWDGWIVGVAGQAGEITLGQAELAARVETIRQQRTNPEPFEVAVMGQSEAGDRTIPEAYAAAGATWWLEMLHGSRGPPEDMLARIRAGPSSR